jgi:hypothetical protein
MQGRRPWAASAASSSTRSACLLLVIVTAASVSDNEAGKQLLAQLATDHPTITKAWVDTGYKTQAIEHGATLGIDVDVVPRNPQVKGFL